MSDGNDTDAAHASISRRRLLQGAGAVAAGGLLDSSAIVRRTAAETPSSSGLTVISPPAVRGAVQVEGIHLTYGDDPAREMVVSWTTRGSVRRPRAELGTPSLGFGQAVAAETRTYVDALSGREVQTHHARLSNLRPDMTYVYAVLHDGARAEVGTFQTAPRGRAPIRFTSFGDQAVPYLTGLTAPMPPPGPVPPGSLLPGFVNDAIGSFSAGDIVTAVETLAPTFHLINGDLCYADLSHDRLRVWDGFFTNNFLIGGGGTSVPSNTFLFDQLECKVIVGAGPPGDNGRRPPIYVREAASWSAFRDRQNPYGFASFDVDPGRRPGDMTRIHATYYAVEGPGMFRAVDNVTLERQRSDTPRHKAH